MKPEISQKTTAPAPLWVTEPFRVFLPLGILASVVGVLVWPLFYAGIWPFHPLLQHPRFMIYGFGFAFVAGFLGTAWPRLLETAELRRIELALLVVTWLTAQILCAFHRLSAADGAFAVHVFSLLAIMTSRVCKRGEEDLPPDGFLITYATLFLGGIFAAAWAMFPGELPPFLYQFSKLFLWQGLLLLPILGVGSFLFARFFPAAPTDPSPVAESRKLWGVLLAAGMVVVSFGIEAGGWVRVGNLLRFAAIVTWAWLAVPSLWKGRAPSTRAWSLRIAIGCIGLSFLIRSIYPGPGHAIEHLLFLSGFGLVMLVVGDRVTMGHSDQLEATVGKSKLWRWLVWLILLAAATRCSADFKASILISHHIYAAILWTIVAVMFFFNLSGHWWRKQES